jgi:hypothetical protein
MVVHNLNVKCVPSLPNEAYPPLIINPYTMLPSAITFQSFELVAWGDPERFQNSSRVYLFQFACCEPLNIPWQLAGKATAKNLLSLRVLETLDH